MAKRLLKVVCWAYAAWLLIILLVVLPAANFAAPWYMQSQYGRKLHTDLILLNPVSLALEVRGADLRQPDGSAFASFDVARVNLSLASLLQRAWVFDDITLTGLDVQVIQDRDGRLNFADLLPPETPEPDPAEPADLPPLVIEELVFQAAHIGLTDNSREKPFSTHYEGLAISVHDLSTIIADGKPYAIDVSGEEGGRLQWRGTVSLPEARSEGELVISGLSLNTFWRFAEPWLNFELPSGTADLRAAYQLSWQDTLRYRLGNGAIALQELVIQPRPGADLPDTWLRLSSLSLTGIAVDSDTTTAQLDALVASGLDLSGWSEGSEVSLATLFDMSRLPAGEETASDEEATSPWRATVGRVALEDSRARWRSEFTDPPQLVIAPLSAEVRDIRWPFEGESPLSLSLAVNNDTTLTVEGALALAAGSGDIGYQLQGLPLGWANPNLPAALNARITDGQLAVSGSLSLAAFAPVTVNAEGAITDFSGRIAGAEEALTRWDSVRWQGLAVDLNQRQVQLDRLLIHNYEGRIHVAEDGSINASNVWQEEVGERAEEIAHDLELDQPWQVAAPEIIVSDSAIDFQDASLPIPFRTVIGDVNGEILDLGTDPAQRARVNIKGSVDGYAPVSLSGTAAPLLTPPAIDLTLSFTGVDLVALTPYSGTYAGYAIERGLLDMTLAYVLENQQLKGRNDIVIEQLKLGEKIDSEQALDLPLELALALLTDANGVIDLKVPVEGDVNDPEFAIGGIVMGALVNLITKAVTAPFALLANLVGSEEDLQRLPFPAGSAELSPAATARLEPLAEALRQRPALVLVARGRLNIAADRESLQQQALDQSLQAEGMAPEEITAHGDDYLKAVAGRYRALGREPDDASFSEQLAAVLAAIPIDSVSLEQLAQQRAAAVKAYLVNTAGLPANRSVIEIPGTMAEADGYSGVELDLDG